MRRCRSSARTGASSSWPPGGGEDASTTVAVNSTSARCPRPAWCTRGWDCLPPASACTAFLVGLRFGRGPADFDDSPSRRTKRAASPRWAISKRRPRPRRPPRSRGVGLHAGASRHVTSATQGRPASGRRVDDVMERRPLALPGADGGRGTGHATDRRRRPCRCESCRGILGDADRHPPAGGCRRWRGRRRGRRGRRTRGLSRCRPPHGRRTAPCGAPRSRRRRRDSTVERTRRRARTASPVPASWRGRVLRPASASSSKSGRSELDQRGADVGSTAPLVRRGVEGDLTASMSVEPTTTGRCRLPR